MRPNYLQRNKGRSRYIKPALGLLAIFISGTIIFSMLDGVLVSVASPLWEADNRFSSGLRNFGAYFSSKNKLASENEELRLKVSSLELEAAALRSGRVQEGVLLELVGRHGNTDALAATVLARPPQTPYDVLIIDAGETDGVIAGASVRLPEGPMLGTIAESYSRRARVLLNSSPGVETEAVLERGNVPVTLVGSGSGNFRIVVPRDTEVEAGDAILSADIHARLLAVVGGVKMESTDSFKEILAGSPINLFNVRYVIISR